MVVAFIGCAVGKSTIMEFLRRERGFIYVKNIVTRSSRFGEYHKVTVSPEVFIREKERGNIVLDNYLFSQCYGYLKEDIEKAISSFTQFYMIDYAIENLSQLDELKNVYKIVLIPDSREFLEKTVKESGRIEQMKEITVEYNKHYSHLTEGVNDTLRAFVIRNRQNDIGNVIFKILKYLADSLETQVPFSPILKLERLKLILENLKLLPSARSGLAAYKMLTDEINKFEDEVWGTGMDIFPRTFHGKYGTDRLYTILTESFFDIPDYSGVTLLLSRGENVFISRYGAIEAQYKDVSDKYGDLIHYSKRIDKVFFTKHDAWGNGVWDTKNR